MDYKNAIREFIMKEIVSDSKVEIQDDDSFVEKNIINSIGIVKLMVFIEQTFNIDLVDVGIETDDLDSINRICELLKGAIDNKECLAN